MQLYSPSIANMHKKQINFSLQEFDPAMQKLELLKKLATDGIDPGSFNILMNIMKKITL